jgi:hypothetical protein
MSEVNVTKFWSSPILSKTAEVVLIDGVPHVKMYEHDRLVASQSFLNNSLEYAEDAAENYVLGIKKLEESDQPNERALRDEEEMMLKKLLATLDEQNDVNDWLNSFNSFEDND